MSRQHIIHVRFLLTILFIFILVFLFPISSFADAIAVTEFPLNPWASNPSAIIRGPDNAMWFVESTYSGQKRIARMKLDGVITNEFYVPGGADKLTVGSDGNIWFTQYGNIGKMTLQGTVTLFALPPGHYDLGGITSGPDGNIWSTDISGGQILRVATNGAITGQFATPSIQSSPREIIAGPDGNLWFIETVANNPDNIGRITPTGTITEFSFPNKTPYGDDGLSGLAAGADGNLWFGKPCYMSCRGTIVRLNPSGSATEFPIPATIYMNPTAIISSADGNLWATDFHDYFIHFVRITPSGEMTEFNGPTHGGDWAGLSLAIGADNNIWFSEYYAGLIGRFSLSSQGGKLFFMPLIGRNP